MKKFIYPLTTLLFCIACGENTETTETAQNIEEEINQFTVLVTDSIGIELGDSAYVFGAIADAEILENGNIMVLDGTYCNIRIFSPEGEHIRTISNRGSGPGELMVPLNLLNWGNDEVGVIDPWSGGVHRFTTDGEWLGLDLEVTSNSFIGPLVVSDSSFVAFKSKFYHEDDGITATAFVGLFHLSPEPEVTYWEKALPWDPSDMANFALEVIFSNYYTVNPETGRVYVSPFHGDGYLIQSFEADGSSAGEITQDYTPIPKTDEEIQSEIEFIEFFLKAGEGDNPMYNYICDPWPNHFAVKGLFIAGDGNLWAMRGGMPAVTFDVWNEANDLVGTATVPGLNQNNSSWKFAFGENQIISWSENPDDFQKIYILEIQ